ncbi:MAG: hypothetical protein IKG46_12260 [Solobacterium sp.]|nr:hypothetical protein [Solobacterium sp.]
MENNTITIHLEDENNVTLNTSNPDINSLVKAIVSARDSIEVNKIYVTSAIDNFDADGFTNLVKKLVDKYLNALNLEINTFESMNKEIINKSNLL